MFVIDKDFFHVPAEISTRTETGVCVGDPTKCNHLFQLLDADGEVYFEGRSGDNSSFEPLDYYRDVYGLTRIDYWNGTAWEEL